MCLEKSHSFRGKDHISKCTITYSTDVLHPGSSAKALSKIPFLEVYVMFGIHLIWGLVLTCYSNITGGARITAAVCRLATSGTSLATGCAVCFVPTSCRCVSSACTCIILSVSLSLLSLGHLLLCYLHRRRPRHQRLVKKPSLQPVKIQFALLRNNGSTFHLYKLSFPSWRKNGLTFPTITWVCLNLLGRPFHLYKLSLLKSIGSTYPSV